MLKQKYQAKDIQLGKTDRAASQSFTVVSVSSIVVLHSVDMPCVNTCSDSAQYTHVKHFLLATVHSIKYYRQVGDVSKIKSE